jgi:hypothetical protein
MPSSGRVLFFVNTAKSVHPFGEEPRLASDGPPGAVNALSADVRRNGIPGVPDTVGPLTLDRVAEAARQQRAPQPVRAGEQRPVGPTWFPARRVDEQSTARGFSRFRSAWYRLRHGH